MILKQKTIRACIFVINISIYTESHSFSVKNMLDTFILHLHYLP